ncbi:MAG: peptidoglycan-associated lipoprotein Pal [Succinivibrio sp.]|nr:peptidoglycan-associated lipoprotein Pal [Succinivibrio sp.]
MSSKLILTFFLGAAALTLSACSTDNTPTDTQVIDGGSVYDGRITEVLDADGALAVGNPNLPDGWTGPAALADKHTIYFGYDSDQIQDQYISVMQENAKYLRANPDARLVVEGHTDERGTPEYNIALGERRARSVARYMQNLGVDVAQISIVSYGEEKPVEPGHDEAAWSKNRRAVLNY